MHCLEDDQGAMDRQTCDNYIYMRTAHASDTGDANR
jgi:hypothetical protein